MAGSGEIMAKIISENVMAANNGINENGGSGVAWHGEKRLAKIKSINESVMAISSAQ
jgi:hypothetical protein